MSTLRFIATYWLVVALAVFGLRTISEGVAVAATSAGVLYVALVAFSYAFYRVMR